MVVAVTKIMIVAIQNVIQPMVNAYILSQAEMVAVEDMVLKSVIALQDSVVQRIIIVE
jgi:hypothetical protein